MVLTMTQGEQRIIPFNLKQDGHVLTPDMISDLKVCVGSVRKKHSESSVTFQENKWSFLLSQKDTLSMQPGNYDLVIHIKYPNGDILIRKIAWMIIKKACCGEEF